MITIDGDLTLTEDTTYEESLTVKGNITGNYDLKVVGNIVAKNIVAWNIVAWNIDAWDIDARNIDARNIFAWDIDAWDIDALDIVALKVIICEELNLKGKCKTRILIEKRSKSVYEVKKDNTPKKCGKCGREFE